MIIIPRFAIMEIPLLVAWWSHRRCKSREFGLLAVSLLAVSIPLAVLAHYHPMICTWYRGPLAATGIDASQIPISIVTTGIIAGIPMKWVFLRNFMAILLGEMLLGTSWVA
jgi:hypothetical protein